MGLLSHQHKFHLNGTLMKTDKLDKEPFDWENGHFAKICIVNPPLKSTGVFKRFTIKTRYCQRCSKKARYFC